MIHPIVPRALVAGAFVIAVDGACAHDAAAGKEAFTQCAACHAVDATNGAGPSLKGVVGRKVGSEAGFRYSRAMKSTDSRGTPRSSTHISPISRRRSPAT